MPEIDTTFVDGTLVRVGDHLAVNPALVTAIGAATTAAATAATAAATAAAAAAAAAAASVPKTLYDANTLLIANVDNTPLALTMPASTILARLASGNIVPATPAQIAIVADFSGAAPLFRPPTTPHADDVEFDSTTAPAGWELYNSTDSIVITPSGNIDPYSALTANDTVHMKFHTDWRRSFLTFQGSTEASSRFYTYAKAVTVPANRSLWGRMGVPQRFAGDAQDANMGIFFSTGAAHSTFTADAVLWEIGAPVAGNPARPGKLTATLYGGVSVGPTTIGGAGLLWEYFCIHKIGTVYHFWTFSDSGQRHYWGNTTHAATMTWMGFFFRNGNSTTPGNAIYSADFLRCIDSATLLPT